MKSNNPTDQIFREKLGDYASEPPMHIWEQLDKKRSSKHRAWMLFQRNWGKVVLALLLISAASFWALDEGDQDLAIAQKENIQKQENQVQNQNSTLNSDENEPALSPNNAQTNNSTSVASNSNFLKENSTIQTDFTNSKVTQSMENAPIVSKKSTVVFSPETTKIIDTNSNQNHSNSVNELALNQNESKADLTNKTFLDEIQNINIQQSETSNSISQIQSLNLNELKYKILDIDSKIPKLKTKKRRKGDPGKGCPKIEKGKKFNMYLDLVGGPELAVRSLRVKSTDHIPYLRERQNSETSKYAMSSGLRFSLLNRRGLAFRTGLMYSQIGEKFEKKLANSEKITITPIEQTDGTVIFDTVRVLGDRFLTSYNRFHTLDIPVIVGFEVHSEKWSYSVNAGVYFNILFRQKGMFLAPNFSPTTFTSGDPNAYPAFRSNVGISYYGSLGFNYHLSKDIQLLFEPQFRYFKNSFTQSNYILDQHYFTIGMLAGIRVKL